MQRRPLFENPILNSPFEEPTRYFAFDEDGITDEIRSGRRPSTHFIPIPKPKKKGKQLALDVETGTELKSNEHIDYVRTQVAKWRAGGYMGTRVTPVTRRLLAHWTRLDRERRIFFCQREAVETAIYITEVAREFDKRVLEHLDQANETANPSLFRVAFKMATGSGKTAVMAMLIAWQSLNKLAAPGDKRFSDAFVIVSPGITIRDRLRVLLPQDDDNYYRTLDLVPAEERRQMAAAKILITNFHAFQLRETEQAAKLTKAILRGNRDESAFAETPEQMVNRVCRELGKTRGVVVINDEAHHCYRRRPEPEAAEDVKGDERKEAERREKDARVWISGLQAIQRKLGILTVYDLSATPFFLKGSGYREGTLFPWVVSDFSLTDAIEAGVVKVPRVPVADDSMRGDLPTYRHLWPRVKDDLPKKGDDIEGDPKLPKELEGALHSLYGNYEKVFRRWEQNADARSRGSTPPVFIVVCNNTTVSKLVFRYIAGWEKPVGKDGRALVPGQLALFSNVRGENWIARPNTILVDSEQLESEEAMSPEFRKACAVEIAEFKAEYRRRFPGRDVTDLRDEDVLREVMNTVGKPGKLGEHVRCVVSVSMLTEGWDTNTVTHVLGVRAFGTQLLCEQVVGRALRRMSYAPNAEGRFEPEYAEIYGVPFEFTPWAGPEIDPKPPPQMTHVYAVANRDGLTITFPRVIGYRHELPTERLAARFDESSRLVLSTTEIPTVTKMSSIIGEEEEHTLEALRDTRDQRIAFLLAKLLVERYWRERSDLFPQILAIARQWLAECVDLKDDTFKGLLLLREIADRAAEKIQAAIVRNAAGAARIVPELHPYESHGSTNVIDFETSRPTYKTREDRCPINYVVADTESWEQKVAAALEDMDEVLSYVKNDHLGFKIPYAHEGHDRDYVPDFVARVRIAGSAEPLSLILEVTGEKRPEKVSKLETARTYWLPAVNNHGGFGRWAIAEIDDPDMTKQRVRDVLAALGGASTVADSTTETRERARSLRRKLNDQKSELEPIVREAAAVFAAAELRPLRRWLELELGGYSTTEARSLHEALDLSPSDRLVVQIKAYRVQAGELAEGPMNDKAVSFHHFFVESIAELDGARRRMHAQKVAKIRLEFPENPQRPYLPTAGTFRADIFDRILLGLRSALHLQLSSLAQ